MKHLKKLVTTSLLTFGLVGGASAYDWDIYAHIGLIEPTYLPNTIQFTLDTAGSSVCPAGHWVRWTIRGATEAEKHFNANVIFQSLLTYKLINQQVRVFGNNNSNSDGNYCTIDYIHLN